MAMKRAGQRRQLVSRLFSLSIVLFILLISSCKIPDTEFMRPAAPTGINATNGYDGVIMLTWNEVDDAIAYSVWKIPSAQYEGISSESIDETDDVYTWLTGKQFECLTETPYASYTDIVSQSGAYVYAVVSIKEDGSGSYLYSVPSEYEEGSSITADESIAIEAVGTDSFIDISWLVPNMYSVLSDNEQILYDDCLFTVSYRKATEAEWHIAADGIRETSYQIDNASLSLDADADYRIMIEGQIFEDGSEINTIASPVYAVRTDSRPYPVAMKSVSVSQGTIRTGIEITWEYPDIPESIQELYQSGYQIERLNADNQWTVVLSADKYVPGETTWIDSTAESNKQYSYRVRFCYVSKDDDSVIMQSDADPITEASEKGWKTWVPADISVIAGDIKGMAPALSRNIEISWTYDVPEEDGSSWKIRISNWSQLTGNVSKRELNINAPFDTFYISVEDDAYHYFTFELVHIVNGEEIAYGVSGDENESISFNQKAASLLSFAASDDLVDAIKLEWTFADGVTLAPETVVRISEDDGDYLPITAISSNGNGSYSYVHSVDDTDSHSYRISVNEVFFDEVATGKVLKTPSEIHATDGEYNDRIIVTFDSSIYTDKIKYKVRAGDEEYIFEEYPEGGFVIAIKDGTADGTIHDVSKAGTVYDVTVSVANKDQGIWSESAPSDQGNILGGAGMNVKAGMYENPDEFTFSWENLAAGATGYDVYVLQDGQYARLPVSPDVSASGCSIPYNSVAGGDSFSDVYTFKIVPRRGDVSALLDSVVSVSSALFSSPDELEIYAGSDSVVVEWDSSVNASAYAVYKAPAISADNLDAYDFVTMVFDNHFVDKDIDGEYAYLVTSIAKDGKTESLKRLMTGNYLEDEYFDIPLENEVMVPFPILDSMTVYSDIKLPDFPFKIPMHIIH